MRGSRRQRLQLRRLRVRQQAQHVPQVGEWVDPGHLAAGDDAEEGRCGVGRACVDTGRGYIGIVGGGISAVSRALNRGLVANIRLHDINPARRASKAAVEDAKTLNKLAAVARATPYVGIVTKRNQLDLGTCHALCYADAAFANVEDVKAQTLALPKNAPFLDHLRTGRLAETGEPWMAASISPRWNMIGKFCTG